MLYTSVCSIGWWQPGPGGVLVTGEQAKLVAWDWKGQGRVGGEASQWRGLTLGDFLKKMGTSREAGNPGVRGEEHP